MQFKLANEPNIDWHQNVANFPMYPLALSDLFCQQLC